MDFISQAEPGVLLLAGVAVCALGIVSMIVFPIVGTLFDIAGVVGGVLTGDPSSCCGCILLLMLLGAAGCFVAFIASVLASCGTPDAVALCGWLGA